MIPNRNRILVAEDFGNDRRPKDGLDEQLVNHADARVKFYVDEAVRLGAYRLMARHAPGAPFGDPYKASFVPSASWWAMPKDRREAFRAHFRRAIKIERLVYAGYGIPQHRDPTRIDGMDTGDPKLSAPDLIVNYPSPDQVAAWFDATITPWLLECGVTQIALDATSAAPEMDLQPIDLAVYHRKGRPVGETAQTHATIGEAYPMKQIDGVWHLDEQRILDRPWMANFDFVKGRGLLKQRAEVDPQKTELHVTVRGTDRPTEAEIRNLKSQHFIVGGCVGLRPEIEALIWK